MTRRAPWGIITVAAVLIGGCGKQQAAGSTTTASAATAALPQLTPLHQIKPGMSTDAILRENDLAIADNKRLNALTVRFMAEDRSRYDRLKKGCEARVIHLTSENASAIQHCVELAW